MYVFAILVVLCLLRGNVAVCDIDLPQMLFLTWCHTYQARVWAACDCDADSVCLCVCLCVCTRPSEIAKFKTRGEQGDKWPLTVTPCHMPPTVQHLPAKPKNTLPRFLIPNEIPSQTLVLPAASHYYYYYNSIRERSCRTQPPIGIRLSEWEINDHIQRCFNLLSLYWLFLPEPVVHYWAWESEREKLFFISPLLLLLLLFFILSGEIDSVCVWMLSYAVLIVFKGPLKWISMRSGRVGELDRGLRSGQCVGV